MHRTKPELDRYKKLFKLLLMEEPLCRHHMAEPEAEEEAVEDLAEPKVESRAESQAETVAQREREDDSD